MGGARVNTLTTKALVQTEASEDIFIKNLQRLIQINKLTEAALSRKTGIAQPTLHKILTGKTNDPRLSTLKMLAKYFCTTIDRLSCRQIIDTDIMIPQGGVIPILSWSKCTNGLNQDTNKFNENQQYMFYEENAKCKFALISKHCMESRFPLGTILIINRAQEASDGDFVIVHYPNTKEATIRKIHIDGPDQILLTLNGDISKQIEDVNLSKFIIGTLIQTRFNYKQNIGERPHE